MFTPWCGVITSCIGIFRLLMSSFTVFGKGRGERVWETGGWMSVAASKGQARVQAWKRPQCHPSRVLPAWILSCPFTLSLFWASKYQEISTVDVFLGKWTSWVNNVLINVLISSQLAVQFIIYGSYLWIIFLKPLM